MFAFRRLLLRPARPRPRAPFPAKKNGVRLSSRANQVGICLPLHQTQITTAAQDSIQF
jgi:hypothetical protein